MNRKLTSIVGNSQRLDGGAMFGNAPKALWTRWAEPDEHNRIPLACRALLVEEEGRRILFETGIGAFFEPKLRERFGVVESEHVLLRSLEEHGLKHTDIDVVVLSHLHFDHAGGLLTAFDGRPPRLLFDNATFVVSEDAWQRALHPHPRDRASFIPALTGLLEASGRLQRVNGERCEVLGDGFRLHYSEGHTPGLLLTEIATGKGPVLFCGDLIPGSAWVHVPLTMGYDRFPERLIDEKSAILRDLLEREAHLFFTHDPDVSLGTVQFDGRRYSVNEPVQALENWG